jgi:phosphonoacetaldehyde hydrolase
MWAVSVIRHGNEVGLSKEELESLPAGEREALCTAARARLSVLGPHYIIDSTADLIPVIDDVSARLARGERP